jgi:hypothetical protein
MIFGKDRLPGPLRRTAAINSGSKPDANVFVPASISMAIQNSFLTMGN